MDDEVISLFPLGTERSASGHLMIAGHDLAQLAKTWGTPLYVFDAGTVRNQVNKIKQLLTQYYAGPNEITYAAKSYFSLGAARHMAEMGLGVDVVSLAEMSIARKAGFDADKVHLHGNNKSEEELLAALDWGIHAVVVDSLDELLFFEKLAEKRKKKARIWLRVTPGIEVDTHPDIQTGHLTSKFGFLLSDGQAAEGIRRAQASPWFDLVGLHAHLGSQLFEAEPYLDTIEMLLSLADRSHFLPIEICPGGGWGVRYTLEDSTESPELWVKTVGKTVSEQFARRGWPLPKLVLEPGRYIAAQAGVSIYTVGTTKVVSDGTTVVAVDGGMADNIRPAIYGSKYSLLLVNRPASGTQRRTSIVGKFCESGDILISNAQLPEMHRDDVVAMPASGAYQLAMSSNYNMAPRPTVLWLTPGNVEMLQKRETLDAGGWWMGA
jgi:diaminopimelate decarboxylase